jgi:CCR4-NOT transcription complex subunit 7/8
MHINTEDDGEDKIQEVYNDNFLEEIKKISLLIDKYNFVSLDTEFPGFVYNHSYLKNENQNYGKMKNNVDNLKLIQVGISLRDKYGNVPKGCSTWQFNFNFDVNVDKSSPESISLLTASGINFQKISKYGISMELFAEFLMISGLVLNDNITWISFHGSYDFAYMLKILTNQLLPDTEIHYIEILQTYFPFYYDIRYLIRHYEYLKGSLSKLALEIEVKRYGLQHQAGSDSLVTGEIFFKLKKTYLSDNAFEKDMNILFSYDDIYENTNQYNNTMGYSKMNQQYVDINMYNNFMMGRGYNPNIMNSNTIPYQYVNVNSMTNMPIGINTMNGLNGINGWNQ